MSSSFQILPHLSCFNPPLKRPSLENVSYRTTIPHHVRHHDPKPQLHQMRNLVSPSHGQIRPAVNLFTKKKRIHMLVKPVKKNSSQTLNVSLFSTYQKHSPLPFPTLGYRIQVMIRIPIEHCSLVLHPAILYRVNRLE